MDTAYRVFAGALLMSAAGGASAQDAPRETAADRIVRSFAECRAIESAEIRLKCFDKATVALETSIKTREVRIVDRADIRKTRRSLFGLTLPSIRLFGGGDDDKEEAFTEIKSTVASARPTANNRVDIRLAEEGSAVWQTTDPMDFPPKSGAAIRIRQGVMGNYFITVEGRTYRGMRVH